MRYNLSTAEPDWKQDSKVRFHDRVCFILTEWNFTTHNQECEAMAKEYDYFYSFDPDFGYAFFTPKSRENEYEGRLMAANECR